MIIPVLNQKLIKLLEVVITQHLFFLHCFKNKSNIFYTIVHTPPGGTVTVTPLATVTGPNVPAFRDTGIV